jgi:hypothetical protein
MCLILRTYEETNGSRRIFFVSHNLPKQNEPRAVRRNGQTSKQWGSAWLCSTGDREDFCPRFQYTITQSLRKQFFDIFVLEDYSFKAFPALPSFLPFENNESDGREFRIPSEQATFSETS